MEQLQRREVELLTIVARHKGLPDGYLKSLIASRRPSPTVRMACEKIIDPTLEASPQAQMLVKFFTVTGRLDGGVAPPLPIASRRIH